MPMNLPPFLHPLLAKARRFLFPKLTPQSAVLPPADTVAAGEGRVTSSSTPLARVLLGATAVAGGAHFPSDIIGGSCPRVQGEEENIVWNAAVEACDSERVHVVWQSTREHIWFLAVRSADLVTHPGSWCPFACVLPGLKDARLPGVQDARPAPIFYTYYGDELAMMMSLGDDGLHIYRGTHAIVRAKAERMAQALGNAKVVELTEDFMRTLSPTPWYSLSLFEERARRILATASILVALSIAGVAFLVWLFASLSLVVAREDLAASLRRTESKTQQLLETAQSLRTSRLREQLAVFATVNDGLLDLNGFLEVYEVKDGKARWRARVPSNVTADRINAIGGQTIESNLEGTIIGNQREIEYEKTKENRR